MANFCSNCGAPRGAGKFCGECGTAFEAGAATGTETTPTPAPAAAPEPAPAPAPVAETELWSGSPDMILAPRTATSTRYRLTSQRLFVETGLLSKKTDTIELYRVKDIRVRKSMKQRTRSAGDVVIASVDSTTPEIVLESVQSPDDVAEILRRQVAAERARLGVRVQDRVG